MTNTNNNPPLMKAALSHYVAEKDKVLAELDIYLNRPVGVGEHAKVTDEVISLFKKLDEAQGVIELINGIIEDNNKAKTDVINALDKARSGSKNKKNGHSA